MPIVPFTKPQPKAPQLLEVDDTYLAIAAASMHEMDRLFDVAGDVVQSGLTQRLYDIRKSTAPISPQQDIPPAKIIPIPTGKG